MSDHLRGYGWRHATWCRCEKAEGTCDCGLRKHQDAASPPAADPLDVERLAEALSFLGEDDILADGSLWKIGEIVLNAADEYARLTREGEQPVAGPDAPGSRPSTRHEHSEE